MTSRVRDNKLHYIRLFNFSSFLLDLLNFINLYIVSSRFKVHKISVSLVVGCSAFIIFLPLCPSSESFFTMQFSLTNEKILNDTVILLVLTSMDSYVWLKYELNRLLCYRRNNFV